jgi:hypothetical protein
VGGLARAPMRGLASSPRTVRGGARELTPSAGALRRTIGTEPDQVPIRPQRPTSFNRAHRLHYVASLRRTVRHPEDWDE